MIPISDQHLTAHENEQRKRSDALALQWYRQQGARLPQGSDDELRELLRQAHETGDEVGLESDEDDRLRRLMAFHAILPDPNGDQWLIAIDAVFDERTSSDAIGVFERLVRGEE